MDSIQQERVQTITLLNKANLMHLPRLTSVWRRRIEEESGGCSRAALAEEEEASVRAQ
jgi:hypothetical protein